MVADHRGGGESSVVVTTLTVFLISACKTIALPFCACPVSWASRGVANVAHSNILRTLPYDLLLGRSPQADRLPVR